MARPKHRSETHQVTVTLPHQTYGYLVAMAAIGKLGPSEADVAAHLLIREVDNLMAIDYLATTAPKI